MKVEQYVMAYKAEQDRIRAMLPDGYESLRPVLRINAEVRKTEEENIYVEFNTPVEGFGKRGWLNIARWDSFHSNIIVSRQDNEVTFSSPFLDITYIKVGAIGGCPAEKDNNGCFYLNGDSGEREFASSESITSNKEFCDCRFKWKLAGGNAHGISIGGKSVAAIPVKQRNHYDRVEFTAENAAAIECEQVLGSYFVEFERI